MTVLYHEKEKSEALDHMAGKAEAHRDIGKCISMWLGLAPHLAVAIGHDRAGQSDPATGMLLCAHFRMHVPREMRVHNRTVSD